MITVYSRILHYQEKTGNLLSHKQKSSVGHRIGQLWDGLHSAGEHFEWVKTNEPEGKFKVRNYPDRFATVIDQEIESLFIPKKKERKRKPIQKPAFSLKK